MASTDGGVDRVGRCGAGGSDADRALGVVVEQGGGHLGAAGVVDADEQDLGEVGHQYSLGWAAAGTRSGVDERHL